MRVLSKVVLVTVVLGIALIAISTSAFQRRFAIPGPATKAEVERGRYLAEEVAKCPACHTPRKPNGELDAAAWLRGAPIWIKPVAAIPNWADHAPALAGLPRDRKSTRLNSSHLGISYAVFCLKKKKKTAYLPPYTSSSRRRC